MRFLPEKKNNKTDLALLFLLTTGFRNSGKYIFYYIPHTKNLALTIGQK